MNFEKPTSQEFRDNLAKDLKKIPDHSQRKERLIEEKEKEPFFYTVTKVLREIRNELPGCDEYVKKHLTIYEDSEETKSEFEIFDVSEHITDDLHLLIESVLIQEFIGFIRITNPEVLKQWELDTKAGNKKYGIRNFSGDKLFDTLSNVGPTQVVVSLLNINKEMYENGKYKKTIDLLDTITEGRIRKSNCIFHGVGGSRKDPDKVFNLSSS